MQDQPNPTVAEFESVGALLGDAEAQLESIAWRLSPVDERSDPVALTFEGLGRLTSFVSGASSDFETMSELVEQLTQVRDTASPASR